MASLRQIAQETGYSRMTVSRVLNKQKGVSDKARKDILEKAKELDYRPNPELIRTMRSIKNQHRRQGERFAFVWTDCAPPESNQDTFAQIFKKAAQSHAQALGFEFEFFSFKEKGYSIKRILDIIESRGMRYVLLSALSSQKQIELELPWNAFSWVSVGMGITNAEVSRIHVDHRQLITHAMNTVKNRGYKKPAFFCSSVVDERLQKLWSALFVAHHPNPSIAKDYIVWGDIKAHDHTVQWLKTHRPDVIVCEYVSDEWLSFIKKKYTKNVGILCLNLYADQHHISGYDQDYRMLGINAVNILSAQFYRNEIGVHNPGAEITHPAKWVEGKTLSCL